MIYFAYGSNMYKKQMKNRCPDSIPLALVKLKGYRLEFNLVADILEEDGSVTWGAIYTVSLMDIKKLDRYEGYPRYYAKIKVEVEAQQGKMYQAFAYVMTVKGCKEPSDGYYRTIEEGCRNWGLPVKPLREALERSRQRYLAGE